MDDQAETFLMRLLRGSGATGLAGIPPLRGGTIVRPLLKVTRSEVEAYLRDQGLGFRQDPSNRDRRYLRNRIRMELVPYLQSRFDPHLVRRLGRLTDILRAEEEWADAAARETAGELLSPDGEGWILDLGALGRYPLALQRRVVRLYLERLRGHTRRVDFADVERIRRLGPNRSLTLEKGLLLRNRGGCVGPSPPAGPRPEYEHSWGGRARLFIPELDMTFSAQILDRSRLDALVRDDSLEAVLDAGTLLFPLTVRRRCEGDRYRPLGAPGRAKLKEIFRSRGVIPEERDRRPVFLSGDSIVWVLGLPVAEAFKVRASTSRLFRIRREA
jgi:tRNA(Ile)-lysidine synthase